ncbi:MAG: alpha/beta fold hydrolase [Pseudomonadota bacterium]
MTRPRLLLVPGLMCDARVWAPQVDALQTIANVSVVDLSAPDTLTGQARAVIEQIGDGPCALAGLSMGGLVALEVMRLAPEHITHFALWDSNAGADPPDKRRERPIQIATATEIGLEAMTRRELAPYYLGDLAASRPDLTDLLVQMALDLGIAVFRRQIAALRDRHDNWPVLPTIKVPTLIGCGENDQVCPAERHRTMAERVEGAELVVVPDCAHLPMLERPEIVTAALVDWLQRKNEP